jgi:hypothetical protein
MPNQLLVPGWKSISRVRCSKLISYDQEGIEMNRMRTARSSARGLAVGAVAALALAASAAGTAVAAQPAQSVQQVPTYTCDDAIEVFGLVSGLDCTASNGATRLGLVDGPFVISTPTDSFTCDTGLAALPAVVLGFDCVE